MIYGHLWGYVWWHVATRGNMANAGLKEVAKLKQLYSLDLQICQHITKAGVAELRKALPKCTIFSNPKK